ncbi:MAG: hypothetical protein D6706_21950, partial [Chloroflexi bacterium]
MTPEKRNKTYIRTKTLKTTTPFILASLFIFFLLTTTRYAHTLAPNTPPPYPYTPPDENPFKTVPTVILEEKYGVKINRTPLESILQGKIPLLDQFAPPTGNRPNVSYTENPLDLSKYTHIYVDDDAPPGGTG